MFAMIAVLVLFAVAFLFALAAFGERALFWLSYLWRKKSRINYGWVLFPMFFILFAAVPLLAADAPAGEKTFADQLVIVINGTLLPLALALSALVARSVAAKIKQKYGLQVSAYTLNIIEQQAESVVQMAAEKAAAYAKAHEGAWPAGHEQLESAVVALMSRVPSLTREQADEQVHSALARIPGLGATGDQAYVPK